MRALEPWVVAPMQTFITESSARLILLMTTSGQVVAQHGFSRSLDVMTASALGAAIVASTEELVGAAPKEQPLPAPVLAENFEHDLNASLKELFGR